MNALIRAACWLKRTALSSDKFPMGKTFLFAAVSVLLAACAPQLEDYVKSGPDRELPKTQLPIASEAASRRISSGAVLSQGTNVTGRFVLEPTQRKMSGSHVSGTFSLHHTR